MIGWEHFVYFAVTAVLLWAAGAWSAWKGKAPVAYAATVAGLLVFFSFILLMWVALERPPLRTMGETRLWYSFFLPLTAVIVYARWHYKWILTFATLMAVVFICVNLFKPEIHTKTLMPALQSPWFAPHVIVYMFAYAVLGASAVMALYLLIKGNTALTPTSPSTDGAVEAGGVATPSPLSTLDNLVYVGFAFMTFGMLFGALWAKEAWGHYWSWDPKETWAAITWFAYLVYIHYRRLPFTPHPSPVGPRQNPKTALWLLIACFLLLQMCWWGINYLPSAQGASVHTYSS